LVKASLQAAKYISYKNRHVVKNKDESGKERECWIEKYKTGIQVKKKE